MIANNIKERFDKLNKRLNTIKLLHNKYSVDSYLSDPITIGFIKSLDDLINDINELGPKSTGKERNILMSLKIDLKHAKLVYELVPKIKSFYNNNKDSFNRDNTNYAHMLEGGLYEVSKLEEHGFKGDESFDKIKKLLITHHYNYVTGIKLLNYLTEFNRRVDLGKSVFDFEPGLVERTKMTLIQGLKEIDQLEQLMTQDEFKSYVNIRNKLQNELDKLKSDKKAL